MKKLKYLFYSNIDNKVVYLQTLLNKYYLNEDQLLSNFGLKVSVLDNNNNIDLQTWCNIVNNSYDDCLFNSKNAKDFLTKHLYLVDTKIFLFYKSNVCCASVSIGYYKNNKNIGGLFRIAVDKKFQGQQYGKASVLYALSYLQRDGCKLCEDIISSKRRVSLNLHLNVGRMIGVKCNIQIT